MCQEGYADYAEGEEEDKKPQPVLIAGVANAVIQTFATLQRDVRIDEHVGIGIKIVSIRLPNWSSSQTDRGYASRCLLRAEGRLRRLALRLRRLGLPRSDPEPSAKMSITSV